MRAATGGSGDKHVSFVLTFCVIALAANSLLGSANALQPKSWPILSTCVWALVIIVKGWNSFDTVLTGQVLSPLENSGPLVYFELMPSGCEG
jgi:hypothetical protein